MTPERLREITDTLGLVHDDVETAMYAQQCEELVAALKELREAAADYAWCVRVGGNEAATLERLRSLLRPLNTL